MGIATGLIAVDRVTFPSFTEHAVSGYWILLTSDSFPSLMNQFIMIYLCLTFTIMAK